MRAFEYWINLSRKIQQNQKLKFLENLRRNKNHLEGEISWVTKFTFEPMTHATLVNMNHNRGREITPNKDRWVTYESLNFLVCLLCGPLCPFQPLCGTTKCALHFITTYKWPDGKKWSILNHHLATPMGF